MKTVSEKLHELYNDSAWGSMGIPRVYRAVEGSFVVLDDEDFIKEGDFITWSPNPIKDLDEIEYSLYYVSLMDFPICPRCGIHYSEAPGISRRNNITEICRRCEESEGIFEYRISFLPEDARAKALATESSWLTKLDKKG